MCDCRACRHARQRQCDTTFVEIIAANWTRAEYDALMCRSEHARQSAEDKPAVYDHATEDDGA